MKEQNVRSLGGELVRLSSETLEELNTMLLHESPVVRVYAHRALMANQMEIYGDNLNALVADSAEV